MVSDPAERGGPSAPPSLSPQTGSGASAPEFRQPVQDFGLRFLDQTADFQDFPAQVAHPQPYLIEALFALLDNVDDVAEPLHRSVHREVINPSSHTVGFVEDFGDSFRQALACCRADFPDHGHYAGYHGLEASMLRPPCRLVLIRLLLSSDKARVRLVGHILNGLHNDINQFVKCHQLFQIDR